MSDLATTITTWAEHWNTDPKPFIWKATADDIITKVQRGRETLRQINAHTDHKRPQSWAARLHERGPELGAAGLSEVGRTTSSVTSSTSAWCPRA